MPPQATTGHLSALSVPGVGHLQILCCSGAGHLPTLQPFPGSAFDTHVVSYQNITTQRILLGKKTDWLKGHVKACSWFYACISSLLIKPELHSEIWSYQSESTFLVIESNFCWYYLKSILSYECRSFRLQVVSPTLRSIRLHDQSRFAYTDAIEDR